jgi:tetratricopeptide (TPR) repeat protein
MGTSLLVRTVLVRLELEWSRDSSSAGCLSLDPNNAIAHGNLALLLSNSGRHVEALAEAKHARELDPLELPIVAIERQILLHAGRTDEALDSLRKTAELEPNFWMPHLFAASAYIEKGMYLEAIAESAKEKELWGTNTIPYGVYALAKSGRQAEARAQLDDLLKSSTTRYVPTYRMRSFYNALGMHDKALEWLEKGYEQRDPQMTFLNIEPKWSNLRNEPRFVELRERMRFD